MSRSQPSKIGRYEIVDRLGAGGMGVVYLAKDPLLSRTVAIKVLPSNDDELRERFAREARSAASLRHANVVTIYDVGDDDGKAFLAMEFIDGESLAELIHRRAAMPIERRLEYMIELCSGLGYAHRNGIVHRDIKPGNLMITGEGTLKVLDFGLARVTSDARNTGLTRVGAIMGTPHYMSPEQVEGRPVDGRSDIFAVGAVLYELIAFRKAYTGDMPHVVLNHIMNGAPVPLEEVVPGIDPDLVAIVSKAMAKRPEDRYQTLESLAADLERVRTRSAERSDEVTRPNVTGRSGNAATPAAGTDRTPARGGRTRANLDAIAQRRAAQVDGHLKAATEHLAAGKFEEAVASCEHAVLLSPDDERALDLLAQAHAAIDERQVRSWLDEARAHVNAGDLTAAQALVEQTLMLRAESPEGLRLLDEMRERRAERVRAAERARATAAALDRASRSLAGGAPEAASRAASEALAYDPENEAALEIRRRAAEIIEERRSQEIDDRAAECVAAAEAQSKAGDLAGAVAALEAFAPEHPVVADALARTKRSLDEHERRMAADARRAQQVAAARAAALEALSAGRNADAERIARDAAAQWPDDVDVQRIAASVRAAVEAAQRTATPAPTDATSVDRQVDADATVVRPVHPAPSPASVPAARPAPAGESAETVVVPRPAKPASTPAPSPAPPVKDPPPPLPLVSPARPAPAEVKPAPRSEAEAPRPPAPRPAPAPAPPVVPAPVPPPAPAPAPAPVPPPAPAPVQRHTIPPAAAIAAAVVVVGGAGLWFALGSGPAPAESVVAPPTTTVTTSAQPSGGPGAATAPSGEATPPPAPPVASNTTPSGGTTSPGRPEETRPTVVAPNATPNAIDAEATRVSQALVAASRRGDIGQAMRALDGASPAVVRHPLVRREVDVLLVRARNQASDAAADVTSRPGASANAEVRKAQEMRAEAAALEGRAQLVEAIGAYLAATGSFTQAGVALAAAQKQPPVPLPAPTPTVTNPEPAEPNVTPAPPVNRPPTPAPAAADTAETESAAIRAVLDRYVAAYQRLDVAEIRRLYTGAPATLDLSDVRSYSLALENVQVTLTGANAATATAVRRLRVQMNAGAAQQQSLKTEFSMRKLANGWVIDRIR